MCNQEVISKSESKRLDAKNAHVNPGLIIVKKHVDIIEKNSTPISLEIILTPGFGDNINNDECTGKIITYLEQQFDAVLKEECRIKRNAKLQDGRPHACLYFIKPTSKGLRELDVEAMKNLATRVNVIPIISKSDSLTEDELALNKALVAQDLKANEIKIYDFSAGLDEDADLVEELSFLKNNLPFAISGSYETVKVYEASQDDDTSNNKNNKPEYTISHIREYPWGTFKVEDLNHCDFNYLRNVLFGSHLQELKDTTHSILYENYRRAKLIENAKYRALHPGSEGGAYAGDEASLLDNYYANNDSHQGYEHSNISQDGELMKEFAEKKKSYDNYTNELRLLERKMRVSSGPILSQSRGFGSDDLSSTANSNSYQI